MTSPSQTTDGLFNLFANCVTWTPEDRQAAQEEGWDIFDIDSTNVLEIQAITGSPVGFGTDRAAAEYVHRMANGSPLHMKALLCIAQHIIEQHFWGQIEGLGAANLADNIDRCKLAYQDGIAGQGQDSYHEGGPGRVMMDDTMPTCAMETLYRTTY